MNRFGTRESLRAQLGEGLEAYDPYASYGQVTTQTFRDPRFLRALTDHYADRGLKFDNEEDLIRKFTRDRSWRDMNTVSSARGALEAYQASPAQRQRDKFLQEAWNNLPMFWQEGGRGWAEGLQDNVTAAIFDPINLFGVFAAPGKAYQAARMARLAQGSTSRQAMMAGAGAGARQGAKVEGLISGAAEGIIDSATQMRDIQLGLQDGYSFGQTAGAGFAGGVIGAGAGGVLGGVTGAVTGRGASRSVDQARALGYPDENIGALSQQELSGIIDQRTQYEPPPAASDQAAPEAQALTPEQQRQAEIEAQIKDIDDQLQAAREDYEGRVADGVSPEDSAQIREEINTLARLREMPHRMAKEEEEIRKLAQSNDPAKQREAARRREMFEDDLAKFNVALRKPESPEAAQIMAELEAPVEQRLLTYQPREDGATASVAPEADPSVMVPPRAVGETAAGDGVVPQAGEQPGTARVDAEPDAPAQPPPERVTPPNLGRFRGVLLDEGIDPDSIVGTGKGGRLTQKDVDAAVEAAGGQSSPRAEATKNNLLDILQKAEDLNVAPENLPAFMRARLAGFDKNMRRDIQALHRRYDELDNQFSTSRDQAREGPLTTTEKRRLRQLTKAERDADPSLSREDAEALAYMKLIASRDQPSADVPRGADGQPMGERAFERNARRMQAGASLERAGQFTGAGRSKTGRIQDLLRRGMASSRVAREDVEAYYRTEADTVPERTVTNTGLRPGEQVYQGEGTFPRESAIIEAQKNRAANAKIIEAQNNADKRRIDFSTRAMEEGSKAGRPVDPRKLLAALSRRWNSATGVFESKVGALAKAHGVSRAVVNMAATALRARDAAATPTKREIVPYVTSQAERIYSDAQTGAEITVPKGTTVFVDGASGRVYRSMDEALFARGELKREAPEVTAAADEADAGAAINELLRSLEGADDATLARELDAFLAKKESPATPAGSPPASVEGRLAILRSKDDPRKIRVMTPQQADKGATAATVLGTADPSRWEVRYLPREQYTANRRQWEALWNSLEGDSFSPPASQALPINYAEYRKLPLGSLTEAEQAAFQYAMPEGHKSLDKLGSLDGAALELAFFHLDRTAPSRIGDVEAFGEMLGHYQALAALEARLAPGGVVRPAITRAESAKQIGQLLEGYDSHTIANAYAMIDSMVGDRAPVFKEGRGWSFGRNYGDDAAGDIELPSAAREFGGGPKTMPPVAKLYHEVMHWGWDALLSRQDKIDFYNAFRSEFYNEGGVLDMAKLRQSVSTVNGKKYGFPEDTGGGALNALDNIQEVFADIGSQWGIRYRASPTQRQEASWTGQVMDRASEAAKLEAAAPEGSPPSAAGSVKFWLRIFQLVKDVFNRYVYGRPVSAEMEQVFAKILPDSERLRLQQNRAEPKSAKGKAIARRYAELAQARQSFEDALRRQSDTSIIERARELRDILNSLSMSKGQAERIAKMRGEEVRTSGQFAVLNPLMRRIRERLSDLYEVLEGKGLPDDYISGRADSYDPDLVGGASVSARSPEETAAFLQDIYDHGHAPARHGDGGYSPVGYVPDSDVNTTPVSKLLDDMERLLEDSYVQSEGGSLSRAARKARQAPTPEAADLNRRVKGRVKSSKKADAKAAEAAEAEAKTPPEKRARKGDARKTEGKGATESVAGKSMAELIADYNFARGTEAAGRIAQTILAKASTEPLPARAVNVPKEIAIADKPQLIAALRQALDAGGPENRKRVDAILYEAQRRAYNKALLKPLRSEVRDAIGREVDHNIGTGAAEGIPPQASVGARALLERMTHRDPEVQYVLRTMLYRMLNLMGRATHSTLDNINVFSVEEVARLGNFDPAKVGGYGAFVDFRAPEYKALRSSLRRMSVGLVKDKATPLDAMHEVGHVVARAVLSDADRARIVELYRVANDSLKREFEKKYRKEYADWNLSRAKWEEVLAEEWFAEGLARHMAERVSKREAFQAMVEGGPIDSVRLRGSLDSLVDKASEYVAYIVNGMVRRNDIKQEFRRVMLYGDMLGQKKTPVRDAYAARWGVPTSVAADYVDETLRHMTARKYDLMRAYARGSGVDAESEPRMFYHATPAGHRLRREVDPDVILQPSKNGHNGPGTYLTASARVGDMTYARRGTPEALRRLAQERQALTPDVEQLIEDLGRVRADLGQKRRQAVELRSYHDDDPGDFGVKAEYDETTQHVQDLARVEQEIMDTLALSGVEPDPYVIPVVVRAENTANFGQDVIYQAGDPFVETILRRIVDRQYLNEEDVFGIATFIERRQGVRGPLLFDLLKDQLERYGDDGAISLNEILRDLDYHAIRTHHTNQVVDAETDFLGQTIRHEVLVVFDPENVKHIDADLFDHTDPRLYYRADGEPVNPSGPLTRDLQRFGELTEASEMQVAQSLEMAGVRDEVIDGLRNIMRLNRTKATEKDIAKLDQLQKISTGMSLIGAQSTKMHHIGANWLADWYKSHFSDIQQRFMRSWTPVERALDQLPDAHGRMRRWIRRATGDSEYMGGGQPKSHKKIVRALRYGDDSKLDAKERAAFTSVRNLFDDQYKRLREAGVFVGHRKNYFPQVWNAHIIRKREGEFREAMSQYYIQERTGAGEEVTDAQANAFADKMFMRLSDQDGGVYFPVDAQSSTSPGDSLDFNRLIELDRHPGMIERMEPFLESNLEAIVTRYLDASTRRTVLTEKFGVNGQGFKDYMIAMQGADGIARLLSTNRVIEKTSLFRSPTGEMEEMVLRDVTYMPFAQGDPRAARGFASELIEVHESGGAPAARTMLETIGPRKEDGSIPLAYQKRVDAILGALNDYKGKPAPVEASAYDMITNAMAAAHKQPLADSKLGGMAMVHATRRIRNFNAVTLLSFTTLTSFSDLVLPALRSGNLGAYLKGLTHMTRDPELAELIRGTGVAIENQIHEHLSGIHGGTSSVIANAFFNATGLTPYTEMARRMAAATGYESFIALQKMANKHYKPGLPPQQQPEKYKIAHRHLMKYGLGDFLPDKPKGQVTLADRSLLETDDAVRASVIRFANDSVFLPNADDIPMWAQTPIGATVFQLKSYPLMLGRLAKDALLDDLAAFTRTGELDYLKRPAMFLSLGPAFGVTTLALKDVIQMRGGEERREPVLRNRNVTTAPIISIFAQAAGYDPKYHGDENDFLGWYFEGMTMLGGFGLILELMHDVVSNVDNGAYGQTRILSAIGGPAVGTALSAVDVAGGAMDLLTGASPTNAKRRAGVREAVRRIPGVGQTGAARESIVDALAGEAEGRGGGGGNSFSSGFSGGFQRGF